MKTIKIKRLELLKFITISKNRFAAIFFLYLIFYVSSVFIRELNIAYVLFAILSLIILILNNWTLNYIKKTYDFNFKFVARFVRIVTLFVVADIFYFILYYFYLIVNSFTIYHLTAIILNFIGIVNIYENLKYYSSSAYIMVDSNVDTLEFTNEEWIEFQKKHNMDKN